MQSSLDYAKAEDVATKSNFDVVRFQLCAAIKTNEAHRIHSITKKSGQRWSMVMEVMYHPTNGMLRTYKKPKNHRNFRVFVENVFKKVMNFVSFNVSAGNDITEDIKELNSVGIEFFQVKSDGEKKNQMRKENLAWQSEKMAKNKDELRLI